MARRGKGKKTAAQQKKNNELKKEVEEVSLEEEVPKLENIEETPKTNKKNSKNVKDVEKEVKSVEENDESSDSDNADIDDFISEQTITVGNGNEIDNEENNEQEEEENENDEQNDNQENLDEEEEEEEEEQEQEEQERPAINNIPALNKRYNEIRLDTPGVKIPWIELQAITYNKDLGIDDKTVHDDLKRELAFYEQGLAAALEGRKKYKELNKPFSRPDDYFAEMVKTDEQMSKIRQNMIEESESIKNAEAAKRQRDLRKYGKKVQTEKLLEKNKNKKMEMEKINRLKRKRSDNNDDDFDVSLDFNDNDNKNNKPQKSKKRLAKDKKFGYGGKKRGSKQNTAESSADMSGFSHKKMKATTFGGAKNKKAKRPGKNKRMASRR
ncbi:Ebp2-domain-containing protein [Piromyces finnis]|uniref:Ebp2-domain-containing protein n=1 Tax=Piromyces finnis TaxID=1754191 RepID=A0A1Y1VF69_9FUNG|nr:Ebp2-domain-containing protein [Piromyces finnis]|eukprot:ORX54708.1 Ebp2-domain-containing protein [Piromyces finnis]